MLSFGHFEVPVMCVLPVALVSFVQMRIIEDMGSNIVCKLYFNVANVVDSGRTILECLSLELIKIQCSECTD